MSVTQLETGKTQKKLDKLLKKLEILEGKKKEDLSKKEKEEIKKLNKKIKEYEKRIKEGIPPSTRYGLVEDVNDLINNYGIPIDYYINTFNLSAADLTTLPSLFLGSN